MTIKVFLADDHAVVRDGISALLEGENDIHVVGAASNGRKAVRQVKKLDPDVVVMDIAMPELNGIEATAQICEACPCTRVIILSMHDTTEHIFQALKAGAKGYLLKESAGKEVVTAIRSVHAGRRYLSHRIEEKVIDDYVLQRQMVSSQSPIEKLSPREKEILQLVVEGKSSAKIAETLFISPKTVETYRSRLMQKLGVRNLPGLVKFAIQHGLTTFET
ncbi:MAG: response regulator transcription factor [Desulfobacteraceae bacterium]|nr:response regulator transcription factor [Desulfobacteraceae bacterium]